MCVDFRYHIGDGVNQFQDRENENREKKEDSHPHNTFIGYLLPARVTISAAEVEREHGEKPREAQREETEKKVEDIQRLLCPNSITL